MCLNVCGIVKNIDLLTNFVNNKKPDIICLTETHITEDINDFELNINNYNYIRTNSSNSRTGGVLTYLRDNINFNIISNDNQSIHGTWFHVLQITGLKNAIICNLYRSPNSSISEFFNKFINYIDNLLELSNVGDLLVMGDFNIDVSNDSYYSCKLINELKLLGLRQLITEPTRITIHSSTIIDLVFSNCNIMTKVLTSPRISDHNIIMFNIGNNNFNDVNPRVYFARDMKKFSKVDFQLDLRSRPKKNKLC